MQKSVSKTILLAARSTIMRFPFVLLCATTGTILLVIAAGLPQIDDDLHRTLFRMVMSLYLGMLAGISATVFCERNKLNKWKEYLLNLVLVLLMLLYYYSLPAILGYVVQTRFILLVIACHACVAFAPFMTSNTPNAFWQYNKQLFLRILTSAFYSLALFVGLSLAILAIDNLFALHIDDIIYGKLYIMVVGIFNTFFFLTGIPNDIESLELESNFPKGLKIFTQFILLPLVTLYLLILYTYELKIIITQVWPVGWVSYLVLGFSIAGMLALLLVWPLRNHEKQHWIKTFTHYFYVALLPLIALLFVAIGKRVMQYGVTEDRYFIIILAIWLLLIDVYFLFSQLKNIKIIPLSLFIFCLFAAYSPWSAYKTSANSQLKRLKNILEENQHLKNGKAVSSTYKVAPQTVNEISSATYYLINTHGLGIMQPLFSENLDSVCSNKDTSGIYLFKAAKVLSCIGIDYSNPAEGGNSFGRQVNLNVINSDVVMTKGFEYLISFNIPGNKLDKKTTQVFHLAGDSISLIWVDTTTTLQLLYHNAAPSSLNILSVVDTLIGQFGLQYYDIAPEKMQFDFENEGRLYRIHINNINARLADQSNGMELYNLSGQLLISGN